MVKVAWVRVIASRAIAGLAMSFSPLARQCVMLGKPLAGEPLLDHA